ncbi:acyl-CoA dehydrogenase family protein [Sinorhizobium sp. BG8]|uniref:acyl-CoA dehydrogenase family protein n=1 Tax=Sinorhizobium sp. BG8 TaxID=2613773 RepID=UPI00193EBEC3|nr:acyl-CoA dehydrogenase family protein [Sinorhizobium sp. BG8]QRM57593.1 hypothetical protein F3Y30_24235 [Sinorhizobium sp. BG8]
MGTISPVFERPARTAALIATEDEAIAVARTVAGLFATPETATAAPENEATLLELFSRCGLLGVSVPTEHGGIDVSNTVLADVCSILAQQSSKLGAIVAAHLVGIEQVRSHGTESQRETLFSAALAGARLARAHPPGETDGEQDSLSIATDGLGWHLDGECYCTPAASEADWLLVPAHNDANKAITLLLPSRLKGLRYPANVYQAASARMPQMERVVFTDLPAIVDVLLPRAVNPAKPDVPDALELLLEAANLLGAGRRRFQRALHAAGDDGASVAGSEAHAPEIGALSVRLAAAEATIENAGRALDAAQIGSAERHRVTAYLAATAACVTAAEAASDARRLLDHLDSGKPASHDRVDCPTHIAALVQDAGLRHLASLRDTPPDGS